MPLPPIICLCVAVKFSHSAIGGPAVQSPPGDTMVPLTIELRRDVLVRRDASGGQRRGVLYADTSFTLKRGARLVMVEVGREGGCRVRYEKRILEVSTCPWLPGFSDHQRDVFRVRKAVPRVGHHG